MLTTSDLYHPVHSHIHIYISISIYSYIYSYWCIDLSILRYIIILKGQGQVADDLSHLVQMFTLWQFPPNFPIFPIFPLQSQRIFKCHNEIMSKGKNSDSQKWNDAKRRRSAIQKIVLKENHILNINVAESTITCEIGTVDQYKLRINLYWWMISSCNHTV